MSEISYFWIYSLEDEKLKKDILNWEERKKKKLEIVYDFLPEDFTEEQIIHVIKKVVKNDEDDYRKYLPESYKELEKSYKRASRKKWWNI